MKNLKKQIQNIPNSPGIYQFFDKDEKLLYIGKAKVLNNRVPQYFRASGDCRPTVGQMVSQIVKITTIKTQSEIEALFLESEMIRKLLPKYNVRLRDDKTFLMIKITREGFPRVFLIRFNEYDKKDKGAHYFGPYTSGEALKKALKILRKIFLFADCSDSKLKSYRRKERPCLLGMIKQCNAPCVNKITLERYSSDIDYLKLFLKGQKKRLIQVLKKEMILVAKKKNYELVAELREKIEALGHLNKASIFLSDQVVSSTIINRIEAYDISNISGQLAVGSMAVVEGGVLENSAYRKFKIKTVEGPNDVAMIGEVLERRFTNDWPFPDLVVIDGGLGQFHVAQRIIREKKINTRILAIAKGVDRKRDELVYDDPALAKMLKKDDNLNKLIKIVRDEAHRFAVGYFRGRQIKKMITGKE